MTIWSRTALAAAIAVTTASPAFADATAFLGASTTPESRMAKGFAIGAGLLILGFEFEYASTSEDVTDAVPSLRTGSGNLLLQTPFAIFGVQPYVTTGAGLFRETLAAHQETGFVLNTGGGVKVSLIGPLRLRLDYRVFKLSGDALHSPAHRLYAGINLRF
jgi:hypothetical protein